MLMSHLVTYLLVSSLHHVCFHSLTQGAQNLQPVSEVCSKRETTPPPARAPDIWWGCWRLSREWVWQGVVVRGIKTASSDRMASKADSGTTSLGLIGFQLVREMVWCALGGRGEGWPSASRQVLPSGLALHWSGQKEANCCWATGFPRPQESERTRRTCCAVFPWRSQREWVATLCLLSATTLPLSSVCLGQANTFRSHLRDSQKGEPKQNTEPSEELCSKGHCAVIWAAPGKATGGTVGIFLPSQGKLRWRLLHPPIHTTNH